MNLDPYTSHRVQRPPGTEGHPLGTDDVGRDLLARLVYGGRVSLTVGLVSTLISIAIGLPLGLFAGYYGGVAGNALMRIADVFQAFPR
jgi:peptide/nickel transport system permease protein